MGNEFLRLVFHALQDIKSEAGVRKECLPYLCENYNIQAWYIRPIDTEIPTIGKMQNSYVAAFNEYSHLPSYIFMMPDKDILTSIDLFDVGVKKIIFDNLH